VTGVIFGLEVRDDCRVPHVGEEGRGGLYHFGIELGGLRVLFSAGPNGIPRPVFIFILFTSFPFQFSYFLYIFSIFGSNCFKPNCKIFKNSKQHSKTVTNMFSEAKQDF
jgi:hypothetical protein